MRLPYRGSSCIDDQTVRLAGLQTPFPSFVYHRMDLHQMASLMDIPIWTWTLVPNSHLSTLQLSFLGICFRSGDTKLDAPLLRHSAHTTATSRLWSESLVDQPSTIQHLPLPGAHPHYTERLRSSCLTDACLHHGVMLRLSLVRPRPNHGHLPSATPRPSDFRWAAA